MIRGENKPAPKDPPRTLEEAHQQLEGLLPAGELAKIDAMKSEKEMVEYHFSIGRGLRNQWCLWGSPLTDHLGKLGFSHPDDMSAVILETLWCRRHHRDFRLQERAHYYQIYWKAAATPPATAVDPDDHSEVAWTSSFCEDNAEKPRAIHVGRSKKTGRWLAYEFDKGVYVPDTELAKEIKASASDPFAGKKGS